MTSHRHQLFGTVGLTTTAQKCSLEWIADWGHRRDTAGSEALADRGQRRSPVMGGLGCLAELQQWTEEFLHEKFHLSESTLVLEITLS
ncbi:hypothetical protein PFLUV_G00245740 [Perca fluviatilis]|uniref:Uncharacterized protein n=1 Tax=Perca fluviatilis TaxID=8168 RepID=A0A6A5E1G0_PERFL|nr:hypothetical protein PFLUV_G00245740 [Perca fluviatilis]